MSCATASKVLAAQIIGDHRLFKANKLQGFFEGRCVTRFSLPLSTCVVCQAHLVWVILLVACWVLQLERSCEEFTFRLSVSGRPDLWKLISSYESFDVLVHSGELCASKPQ